MLKIAAPQSYRNYKTKKLLALQLNLLKWEYDCFVIYNIVLNAADFNFVGNMQRADWTEIFVP